MKSENIAAISTALGAAGVAVIRISGDTPLSVAEKMFKPIGNVPVKDFEPNKMYAGEILADGFTDFGMCVFFKAPKSFTGENTVEFHCHGGTAIVRGILKKAISSGARLAERGEFTKRAFLNGKLSLASAEGLIDMINSETEGAVKAGYSLYREKLTGEVCAMQDELLVALSGIDANMDFPEELLEETSREQVKSVLDGVIKKIDGLLATFKTGSRVKNGVSVGIIGKPNTGKSSLLNALLDYDKAIVSDIAGTTRDIVEGRLDINGVRFNFYDTAGIRDSADYVENLGVGLSKKILDTSDILLFIIDGSEKDELDEKIYSLVKDKNTIVVVNKTDISNIKDDRADVYISALKKDNIESLKDIIYEKASLKDFDLSGDFLCEERHYYALQRAKEKLLDGARLVEDTPLDLIAIDVKGGWDALGEISGKTATEEIIDDIFSRFCVGK